MINANKTFKSQIRKVNYADITLRNGTVLNLEPSDFILGGFSMTDETTTGKFGVGSTSGKTISITINNHTNKFSMYDFYKAIIYMYISVTLEDGTILKERKGKYYVINPTSPGDVITLSGVDSMHLFDKPYNANTVYPASLQSILSDCCLDCGVNIGFGQFENYDFIVQNKPEECTYRQVVSWVAQIAGYNARISNNDYLELVWYDMSITEDILDGGKLFSYDETDTYDGGDFATYTNNILWDGGNFTDPTPENVTRIKSISVSTDDVVITGVMVKNGDNEILEGEDGYCITISDNDFVAGKEKEIAQYLGNRLIGLQFRPLSCQIANNPLIEPMDVVYVYDRKGNAYFTFVNSVNYSISGFTTIACKAEDPIRNESHYISKDAQAVVKARKEAKKELSSYDKAVQNMNSLAANAMGLYRETEELAAGNIYYMSNKPIYKNENGVCEFIANSFVYKMTGDGFFVSTDGGLSYTSGLDAEGNAVVNVLSAIGITFDWAKGGTLTLGGYDNANGVLHVLDENGKVVGKWDNTGITFPPGTTISWEQITDKDNVANKEDIPTDNKELINGAQYTTQIDVNSIITNKVTASFVNALNVKAGSLFVTNENGKIVGKWDNTGLEMGLADGSKVIMSPSEGFYRLIGSTKNMYNSLFYTATYRFYSNGYATITLPDEFKGKDVKVFSVVQKATLDGYTGFAMLQDYSCSAEYIPDNNTVQAHAYGYGQNLNYASSNFKYLDHIYTYGTSFLTSAYLIGDQIITNSDTGISSITSYDAYKTVIDSISSMDAYPILEVTIVALA